jgi:hypothetical protein
MNGFTVLTIGIIFVITCVVVWHDGKRVGYEKALHDVECRQRRARQAAVRRGASG